MHRNARAIITMMHFKLGQKTPHTNLYVKLCCVLTGGKWPKWWVIMHHGPICVLFHYGSLQLLLLLLKLLLFIRGGRKFTLPNNIVLRLFTGIGVLKKTIILSQYDIFCIQKNIAVHT